MKKLLIAAIAVGLMSTSAFAIYVTGTIDQIRIATDGTIKLAVNTGSSILLKTVDGTMTADQKKLFMAAAMTAYAGGKNVVLSGPTTEFNAIELR